MFHLAFLGNCFVVVVFIQLFSRPTSLSGSNGLLNSAADFLEEAGGKLHREAAGFVLYLHIKHGYCAEMTLSRRVLDVDLCVQNENDKRLIDAFLSLHPFCDNIIC